jgi:hypothetical protein
MQIEIGDEVRVAWTIKGKTYPPVPARLDAVDDLEGVKVASMTRIGKKREDGSSIHYYLTEEELNAMVPSTHAEQFVTIN